MAESAEDERGQRSRWYPSSTVLDAVGYLELIQGGVGLAGGSRDTLVQALGYSGVNGASKKKLATISQYGLIDRDGDRYRISDLGRRILIPVSEQERTGAIADAVHRPALFQELGAAFDQQPLPTMLANVIAREYGVTPQASSEVAAIFSKSVEQAGLVVNGVLDWTGQRAAATIDLARSEDHPAPARPALTDRDRSALGSEEYSIPLDNRGRKALIRLPTPTEPADLERILAWISYMRGVVGASATKADDL